MPEQQVKVKFEPHGRVVSVLPGTKILEAAAQAGLTIDTPCGGAGKCGKCRVRLITPKSGPNEAERAIFDENALKEGWRLACQTTLYANAVVSIPDSSLFGSRHQILATSETDQFHEIIPSVCKVKVALAPPTLQDDVPDLLRLEKEVGEFAADISMVRELSPKLRAEGFKGHAILSGNALIDFEPGEISNAIYGAAFDIGTTTLVGVLLNLDSGGECAVASRMNPQVSFGDDVLSRIAHAGKDAETLRELQEAIITEVNSMIEELAAAAGIPIHRIFEVAFSGNTTMEHLLCGIDPSQLGQVPFVPVFAHGLNRPACELGISIHPRGIAYVFPVIGGFVGGDTVAGMLATRLTEIEGPSFMVDIGTNGEIVLAHDGHVWAASTAAGPAFEGARISCGMRATRGAVEKVVFSDEVHCSVIDNGSPIGICGSALIDCVAELLQHGMVTPDGRLLPPENLPPSLPDAFRRRVQIKDNGDVEFVLADGVSLNQRDIRELQLASGAIRAGISILLKQAGISIHDLKRVLIAGGFGSFIRRNHAQRIGLIPPEIDHTKIRYVGNTSLSGARWALLSTDSRLHAETLARKTRHVELSNDPDFAMEFAMAMHFPA
ncbi:MAG TPA: ASKHA domain-containing protein [Candidatus Hydrogenedentes bacterium]|nr:ASKHA domain-containing protein [Candidatus Hydrogenedentota bacterium]